MTCLLLNHCITVGNVYTLLDHNSAHPAGAHYSPVHKKYRRVMFVCCCSGGAIGWKEITIAAKKDKDLQLHHAAGSQQIWPTCFLGFLLITTGDLRKISAWQASQSCPLRTDR